MSKDGSPTLSKDEWCQLYRLLDKMPTDAYSQSYVNNISDVWELVRGELMHLELDPDDVLESECKPGETWEAIDAIERKLRNCDITGNDMLTWLNGRAVEIRIAQSEKGLSSGLLWHPDDAVSIEDRILAFTKKHGIDIKKEIDI